MSLASRVSALATHLGHLLRVERATFAPSTAVGTSTVKIWKRLGMVTIEGSIILASGMAPGSAARNLGTVPAGFRPTAQAGTGAYFYSPTGGPGAVLVAASGTVSTVHYSEATRGALSFSITYEAA